MDRTEILRELEEWIHSLEGLKTLLDQIKSLPEYASLFAQPMLGYMQTGVSFLTANLTVLRDKIQK